MISRSPWTKAPPCPLVLFTPCLRRSLQLFISSLTRTSLQGSCIHPTHPMEPQFFLSTRTLALFDFVLTSGASLRFQRKTDNHSHSSPISSMHHEKHESTLKSTSSMHIILSECPQETNGRLHSKPIMVHSSGW